jgi:plastocyanin
MSKRSLGWLAVALLAAGCSKTNPTGPAPIATGSGTSVRIQGDGYATGNAVFSPQTLNTTVGATVTWTNADTIAHTSVADAGQWKADNIAVNGTFQFTFATAGTYTYKCTLHSGMTGSVIVR